MNELDNIISQAGTMLMTENSLGELCLHVSNSIYDKYKDLFDNNYYKGYKIVKWI